MTRQKINQFNHIKQLFKQQPSKYYRRIAEDWLLKELELSWTVNNNLLGKAMELARIENSTYTSRIRNFLTGRKVKKNA